MMNNLQTYKTIFLEVAPESILKVDSKLLSTKSILNESAFVSYLNHKDAQKYNDEEAGIIYQNMLERLSDSKEASLQDASSKSVLGLPLAFARDNRVLSQINHQPVCNYSEFLKWRMMTLYLGEDLFTTAFLASEELAVTHNRQVFDWKPLISHNNESLHEIMSRGISENHYHLKGSAPHFDLSWISLMNGVVNREKEIENLCESGHKLYTQMNIFHISNQSLLLEEKLAIAALIRCYFYSKFLVSNEKELKILEAEKVEITKKIQALLSPFKTTYDLAHLKVELQSKITALMTQLVLNHRLHGADSIFEVWQKADYFIKFPSKIQAYEYWNKNKPKDDQYYGNRILSGERRFQYLFFRELYSNRIDELEASWFYAYQLIKLQFRAEFVQINDHVGFKNFAIYQNRKTLFIPKKSIYEEALYNLAINSVLDDQYVQSLECRIGPEATARDYHSEVSKIDSYVLNKNFFCSPVVFNPLLSHRSVDRRYFYTIHFIKDSDHNMSTESKKRKNNPLLSKVSYECRDYKVRKNVEIQAKAFASFRKAATSTSHRILGIDAANFEIGCRPEAFAQAFRYLRKNQTLESNYVLGREVFDRIGVTYHAGEDFIDIADGLRAIVEAVRFLDLNQGDRIGHALALGIDPFEYYDLKNWELPMRVQDALDNCVWVYAMLRKCGIQTHRLHEHLRKLIFDLSSRIYAKRINELTLTPEMLYDAWKLRGDDPNLYRKNHSPDSVAYHQSYLKLTKWDEFAECFLDSDESFIRERTDICHLNYLYHFDYDVKMAGYASYIMKIDYEYASVIDQIQHALQQEIAKRNIGIETNPSSNYVIGTFKRYVKHPILRFNNYGLPKYQYKAEENQQLFVSINTDDQGVFATYLENEYALMALALEKEKHEDGSRKYTNPQIYAWLDSIRLMGNQQSFRNRIKP